MSEAQQADRSSTAEAAEPALEEVSHQLSDTVRGLSCPNCGGALDVAAGLRVVECSYCGTGLLAIHEIGTRRFGIEPRIDADTARATARAWLVSGVKKDPKLKKGVEIGEAFLCFLPFFRVQADCVGFALGTEERTRTVGSGKNRRTQRYEVDVERRVERSFDKTYPALNVAEWGIRRVDLTGDPLVPFSRDLLARQGMVFPVTGSENRVMEAALESFKASADPGSGLKRVRFRFLETLRERLTVIYYPVWVVRYRFRQRSYQVLVDAEDGTLAYGKAPGNDLYRAVMLVATEAAAMFIGTTAIQFVGAQMVPLVFIGGISAAILVWGWRRFRYGGVVVEGSGVAGEAGLGETLQTARRLRSPESLVRALTSGAVPGGKR